MWDFRFDVDLSLEIAFSIKFALKYFVTTYQNILVQNNQKQFPFALTRNIARQLRASHAISYRDFDFCPGETRQA